jgi:hypothetical protein
MSTKNWTIVAAVSLGIALAIYGLAAKAILYAVPYEFFKLYEMAVHIHILQSLGILILGVQSKFKILDLWKKLHLIGLLIYAVFGYFWVWMKIQGVADGGLLKQIAEVVPLIGIVIIMLAWFTTAYSLYNKHR